MNDKFLLSWLLIGLAFLSDGDRFFEILLELREVFESQLIELIRGGDLAEDEDCEFVLLIDFL